MPAWIPFETCVAKATAQQTLNVNSVVHLYTDVLAAPDGNTPKADYVAAEADFDDYNPVTVAAWSDPLLAPSNGVQIIMPCVTIAQGPTTPTIHNQIRGYYVLAAGGDLLYAGRFDQDVPIATAFAFVQVEITDQFLTGF